MGFYDDDDIQNRRRKPKRSGYVWTSFISAIIGGLIVLGLAPTLMQQGWFPNSAAQTPDSQNETRVGESETVSVDVTTNIVEAVEKARPAVVGVVNLTKHVNPWTQDAQTVQQGTGSGVIFEKAGDKARVATNHHVVEGADEVEVVLSDGTHVPAVIRGSDEATDLAVLEIDADGIEAIAEFGDSDALAVGEPAIAIGNPLGLDFSQSVTTGIISAKDRTIQVNRNASIHVLQTDAAINPGNSGGPLVNVGGQVIGINSLKIAQQGVEGLGFAIPINDAKPIIEDLIEHGYVIRPQMGVYIAGLDALTLRDRRYIQLPDEVEQGVFLVDVARGGPAYDGGLRQHDVIIALDGNKIEGPAALQNYLYAEKDVGDELEVTFYREGEKQTITLTLGKTMPDFGR